MTEIILSAVDQSRPIARPTCRVENCCNPVRIISRGLCHKHYVRLLKHGDPYIRLQAGKTDHLAPRVVMALRICEGYNASASETGWILGVDRQCAMRWAKIHRIVLRRDPPGQERFFSESRTHRAFVMREFKCA